VWLLAAAIALAADPLSVIPESALGVAVINNLSDVSAKIQKLTDKMQLPVPELLPMAQLYTGAQQGVDDKGTLAAAMFADDREDATWSSMVAVFVPVTDYKAFVAQLVPDDANAEISEVTIFGEKFLVTNKDAFAVLAATTARHLLEQIRGSSKSVAPTLEPLRPWLAKQQAAVVVTPAGKKLLVEKLSALMDTASQAAEQGAAADNNGGDEKQPAPDALASLREMMGALKELLAAADGQLTQLGVGVRIDEGPALHVSARLLFTPQGTLSQWSAGVKPPKAGLLAGLPPGKFALAYGGVAVEFAPALARLVDRMMQVGLSQFGLSPEDRKKLSDILAQQRANQTSTGGVLGQLRPGDSIVATSMSVEHVKDAVKHMKLAREMFALLSKVRPPGGDADKSLYTVSDVTVGDLKALELVTDMSAMIGAEGANGQAEMAEMFRGFFSKLFGGEGEMRAYMTVADDHTVVMAYSKELLVRAVEHVRKGAAGLEADEQIAATNKLLPERAQWAAYISPQGVVQWIDTLLRQLPAELNLKLPPFPQSDPIGAAAKVSAEGLDAELVLPESVVAGIGQYVGTIQQMMQGGAPVP
jgi:hypothetical protein